MSSTAVADEGYDDLEDDGGLSGFWILIIFLVVLSIFAAIVYFAYQRGLDDPRAGDDLPTISANPTPVRETVDVSPTYDARASEVDEELNRAADTTRIVAEVDETVDPLADYDQGTPVADNSSNMDDEFAAALNEPAPQTTLVEEDTPPVPTVAPTRPTQVVESRPVETAPVRSTPPASAGAVGTYAVQAGAYGSNDEATGMFERLSSRIGTLVGSQTYEVNVAEVNGRTFYRLWLGEFASREDANSYCSQLKSAGQDCFVKKR